MRPSPELSVVELDTARLPGHRVRLAADQPLRLDCGAELSPIAADDDEASTWSALLPLDPFGTFATDPMGEMRIGQRGYDPEEALAPSADTEHSANAAGRPVGSG